MRSTLSLALTTSLLLFGACADNTGPSDDAPDPDPTPTNPDPDPPRTVDASGNYRIHSTFDIATNMPGASGSFVNGLIAATDDPDDPMSWVLDQMLAQMPAGTFKTVLQTAKPLVASYLNNKVTQLAPDLVGTLVEIGHRMADLTKNFGVNEKLAVTTSDQQYVGTMTADGVRFKVDTTYVDQAFAANNIDDVTATGIHISYENARLGIGDHTLALPWNKIVKLGLDTAIIPAIDPSATSLAGLLDNLVNCAAVGQDLASQLGVGSAAFWTSACHGGLAFAANKIYEQIAAAGSTLDFHLVGTARAADSNDDYKLDKLSYGEWSGTLMYAGTAAALAQPATFSGERF